MYERLSCSKYFGEYIRNYKERTGINKAARVRGLVFLWASLIISGMIARKLYVLIILAVIGAAVTIHILTIRRRK